MLRQILDSQIRWSLGVERRLSPDLTIDGYADFVQRLVPAYLKAGQVVYDVGGGKRPYVSVEQKSGAWSVFVSNAHGGTDAGTVSAFSDGPGGVLSSIGASPFANHQTAPCWVEISRDGRHLFTVNTAVPSISSYRIHRDGTLRLIGNTPFAGADASTFAPEDARLSPDGSTLWVVDSLANTISGFAVRGGRLSQIAAARPRCPLGATPSAWSSTRGHCRARGRNCRLATAEAPPVMCSSTSAPRQPHIGQMGALRHRHLPTPTRLGVL